MKDLDAEEDAIIAVIAEWYYFSYLEKTPCRTSYLKRVAWVQEILIGNPTRCLESMGMRLEVFERFVDIIRTSALGDTRGATLDSDVPSSCSCPVKMRRTGVPKNAFSTVVR